MRPRLSKWQDHITKNEILSRAGNSHITNSEILLRAGIPSMYSLRTNKTFRTRSWPVHQMAYSPVESIYQFDLKECKIDPNNWEDAGSYRACWRQTAKKGTVKADVKCYQKAEEKHNCRKNSSTQPFSNFIFSICSRDCH